MGRLDRLRDWLRRLLSPLRRRHDRRVEKAARIARLSESRIENLENPPVIRTVNDNFYVEVADDMDDIGGFRHRVPTLEELERIEDEYERDIEADRGSVGGRPR